MEYLANGIIKTTSRGKRTLKSFRQTVSVTSTDVTCRLAVALSYSKETIFRPKNTIQAFAFTVKLPTGKQDLSLVRHAVTNSTS